MGFGRVSKNLASLLQPEARALQRIRGSARLYPEGSKDSYSKAFGPTDHTARSFWAILSLRVTVASRSSMLQLPKTLHPAH